MADPWRGIGFLFRRRRLWPLAILPFIVCFVFYAGSIALGWYFMERWLGETPLTEGAWYRRALGYALVGFYWIVVLLIVAVAYLPVVMIVSGPFNDLLSEKTERLYLDIPAEEPFSIKLLLRSIKVGLLGELARGLTLVAWLLLALCLNLIPIVGQAIAPVASALIAIRYLSLEFTSFSMDRRLLTWKQKREYLRRFGPRTFGFGSMAFLFMLIPFANALFFPALTVGGTLLYCDTALAKRVA